MLRMKPPALVACFVLALAGCAQLERGTAVPTASTTIAIPPGMPANIRYWVDLDPGSMLQDGSASVQRELARMSPEERLKGLPPANFLSISGGGDNGAFGAGLLVGWTAAGTRPEFKIVTGISTGALTAPFAFLGSAYDEQLRAVYTKTKTSDIFVPRSFIAAITDDAMADTRPLARIVAKYVDQDLLDRIAEEYRKGRILLIATTNLDSRRPVVWNIGEIAASGNPKSLELVHKILIASAAIPGAFPPVLIDVEAGGVKYQEMHVDGGAMAQVFLYPPALNVKESWQKEGAKRERISYVLRNARLDPDWSQVERKTLTIVGRAISSLIHTQGVGDLYRIYATAERDGVDFNLAYIGPEFKAERTEDFDPVYMGALFDYGYRLAKDGYRWHKKPPSLTGDSGS